MKTNFKLLIVFIVAVLILLTFLFFVPYHSPTHPFGSNSQACTEEAKLCPDGSAVGRTGPNCEFAECPIINIPSDWKTFSDSQTGVTFRYPKDFSTTYVNVTDWPPKVQVVAEPTSCAEAGAPTNRAGRTEQRMIGNRYYCVTEITGAAAGSIYHQYAYATMLGSREVILTFSLQFPQCVNYDESRRSACQSEEDSLNVGNIIDRIVSTLSIQ